MKKIIIIISVSLLQISFLYAGENNKINLDRCIKIALQNHPSLQVSIETRNQTISKYKIVKSRQSILVNGVLKTVEFLKADSSSDSTFNIPGKDTDIGLFAGLNAVYNLYDHSNIAMEETAKSSIVMSKLHEIMTKSKIVLNVKLAYYNYLFAREELKLRKKLLRKIKKNQKQAQILFDSGARPILDVTKADVKMAQSQLDYQKARNMEFLLRQQLFLSMGIKINENYRFSSSEIDVLPQIKYSLNELYKLSEIKNPEIQIAKLEKKQSKLQISVERAAHIPRVDFVLGLGYENRQLHGMDSIGENVNNENWTPTFHGMLSASLPIYTGGAISARVDSAISEYKKKVFNERDVLMNIRNTILNHYRNITELLKQHEMSKLILINSRKHLLLAQRSYENGVGSQIELNDAEVGMIQAELGFIDVKHQYFLSLAKLSNVVGIEEEYISRKGTNE